MIRLWLVDDHTIIRDGMRALLTDLPDLRVVGEAANGQDLLDALARTAPADLPDLVLLDVNMPVLDGAATMPLLRDRFPTVRVLVLSMLDHERYVQRMLDAGARGYALKNVSRDELLYAIRTVAGGGLFVCTDLAMSFLQKLTSEPTMTSTADAPAARAAAPDAQESLPEFSPRELEVLHLIADGLTNTEISAQLGTSKRTVESHRQNIIDKTGARNTASLIRYAVRHGLVD